MDKKPPAPEPEIPQYASCPFCTLRINVVDTICPHCRKPLPPRDEGKKKPAARPAARGAARAPVGDFRDKYGKWIKAAVPIALALVVLGLIYQRWVGVRITVVPNPSLPVKATLEKKGNVVVVRAAVTNEGEDVPDLSMKSIGVMVEFAYRDGRRLKKRIFPKTQFRGEGALLRGETGSLEIEIAKEGLEEIVFRSEVVDLSAGRDLVPPGGKWHVVPGGR